MSFIGEKWLEFFIFLETKWRKSIANVWQCFTDVRRKLPRNFGPTVFVCIWFTSVGETVKLCYKVWAQKSTKTTNLFVCLFIFHSGASLLPSKVIDSKLIKYTCVLMECVGFIWANIIPKVVDLIKQKNKIKGVNNWTY